MRDLIRELIPHAPEHGLYVAPDVPPDRLRNAVRDYAPDLDEGDVVALYDATILRSAKDGALFTADRFVFQNHDLEAPQTVRYADIVAVRSDRKLLGGRKVILEVNRGRATIELVIDFSGRPGAAGPVARFLSEAMLLESDEERRRAGGEQPASEESGGGTDRAAVREALDRLFFEGRLSASDRDRLLDALGPTDEA
jgi:hypothetical protein